MTDPVVHLALVGPTASGKSGLAMSVAHALGDVEIVSIDSMQVYRGLDIGTAKPSTRERAAVPHHLVDVAEPSDEWSVAQFQRAARAAIADIESRGKRALLVGGTGLYVQAVIDPLTFPPRDAAARAALEREVASSGGVERLYAELTQVDPDAAARIEPSNERRIVRALEVFRSTGRRFSSYGPGVQTFGTPVVPVHLAGVWLPRALLARRIDERVAAMRDAGLVDEVRELVASTALSRTARQAIGYQEIIAHLDGETPDLDDALARTADRTRSFARRQRMWFRRDPRITWVATHENPCLVLPALLALWSR
ncbi:MAG TPA: tRNA (adenosine(37)-N6)-dimethylallyltransferase MiaA [Acidimicrobiia bacterium]|nr:tRNA (adenosine(37)-N6)-dimethylallyltransferase MiaA [Acidimicrobiia bacterium]